MVGHDAAGLGRPLHIPCFAGPANVPLLTVPGERRDTGSPSSLAKWAPATVPSLVASIHVAASSTLWRDVEAKGASYLDKDETAGGTRKLQIKTGESGKTMVKFQAGGASLVLSGPAGGDSPQPVTCLKQESLQRPDFQPHRGRCARLDHATGRRSALSVRRSTIPLKNRGVRPGWTC